MVSGVKAIFVVIVVAITLCHCFGKTVKQSDIAFRTRACQPPHDHYPFCNVTLSLNDRVQDLVRRLNRTEYPMLMTAREGGGGSPGVGHNNITRLGIPSFDFGLNACHGVQSSCVEGNDGVTYCPTSFPNPINWGAAFNVSLVTSMARVIGEETRALYLAGATEFSPWSGNPWIGLDVWSPNINLLRDPRWGRNMEVSSECPMMTGLYGAAYVKGAQEGSDDKRLLTVVTLKHWAAYGLENADGFTRHNFDVQVSNGSLSDSFFPAWEASVRDARAAGVMCSYNAVQGIPSCASPLLRRALESWDFQGYTTSDTGAIQDIYEEHKYVNTPEEAACAALVGGRTDVNSGKIYYNNLLKAVDDGLCREDDIIAALNRITAVKIRLGLFDPLPQPYWNIPLQSVNSAEKQELNLFSALQSMVLLENNGVLPLKPGRSIAVIGPHAKAQLILTGNYIGQVCVTTDDGTCLETPLDAVTRFNKGGKTVYSAGSNINSSINSGIDNAVHASKGADIIVLFLGLDLTVETEGHDRKSIDLPSAQRDLASALFSLKKPVIIVLINGGMVAIAQEKAQASAIISAGYPGTTGAEAIAMTLFGENTHLGGKLPYTVYSSSFVDEVKMSEYELAAGNGRTFRYYTGNNTLYPFGYGKSYTTFDYDCSRDELSLTTDNESVSKISVTVKNTGSTTGDTVIFGYITRDVSQKSLTSWHKRLFAFERVHLGVGESTTVNLSLASHNFGQSDPESGDTFLNSGVFKILITDGSDDSKNIMLNATVSGEGKVIAEFAGK